jgi:hypothetical protein
VNRAGKLKPCGWDEAEPFYLPQDSHRRTEIWPLKLDEALKTTNSSVNSMRFPELVFEESFLYEDVTHNSFLGFEA